VCLPTDQLAATANPTVMCRAAVSNLSKGDIAMGRVIPLLVAVTAALAGLVTIEDVTAERRLNAHNARMSSIREGMTESAVYAAAGPPADIVLDLGDKTDTSSLAASCGDANAVTALIYSFEGQGWISSEFGPLSSSSCFGDRYAEDVICLDERRLVVKTYGSFTF
jgi:hypothetical protein